MDKATNTHPCPVRDCTRHIARGHLMCARHWRMLTVRQRAAVLLEWNGGNPRAGYLLTREAAIAKVNALQARS